MKEEQLINEIKKDPTLFSRIYDAYYSTIFNYSYKRINDFDTAKDITSETFLKAYLKFDKFKWTGTPVIAWLYRIATNEINLHFRSKKYHPSLLEESGILYVLAEKKQELHHEKVAAQKEWESRDQFKEIQKIMVTLPLKYQEVISLKYFENLKIKEISAVLKKPEGTVKSLLSRGISLMKERL